MNVEIVDADVLRVPRSLGLEATLRFGESGGEAIDSRLRSLQEIGSVCNIDRCYAVTVRVITCHDDDCRWLFDFRMIGGTGADIAVDEKEVVLWV